MSSIAWLMEQIWLSLYSNKNLTIASRATPIGSADHAPDEIDKYKLICKSTIRLHNRCSTLDHKLAFYSHWEWFVASWINKLEKFRLSNIQTRLSVKIYTQAMSTVNICLNTMIVKIMKVRPRICPGWPSIRTWMRSASEFPYPRYEEKPDGCTGYPKTYWNSCFGKS
jgi:hypothetical protein